MGLGPESGHQILERISGICTLKQTKQKDRWKIFSIPRNSKLACTAHTFDRDKARLALTQMHLASSTAWNPQMTQSGRSGCSVG